MHSTPPPLVGFNNNVRYRGMRFHIQTEDSGVTRPHILTHLFADGGRVIKSLRTDYAEFVDHPDRPAMIHRMMREQHRAMAIDLRDGRLDATIDTLRSEPPASGEDLDEPRTVKFADPSNSVRAPAPGSQGSAPPATVVSARRGPDAEPRASSSQASLLAQRPSASSPARPSRPPAGRSLRPSRPPEAGKKRGRSSAPKQRRSLGRPSAVLDAKPSAESIFGAAPQESLDDVILSYVTHGKNTPDPRGRK
ncbi:MAG: hypothetical protein RL033_4934 [Pseudomonadota bacterium]